MRALFSLAIAIALCGGIVHRERAEAEPTAYPLTCAGAGAIASESEPPATSTIKFYPAPTGGAPEFANSFAGPPPKMVCSWPDRPFRPSEPLAVCGAPALLFPTAASGRVYEVYNTGSCMHVVSAHLLSSPVALPAEQVIECHAPLADATAPASAFYTAVSGKMVYPQVPVGALPVGSCMGLETVPSSNLFCAPTQVGDTPWENQIRDLKNGAFYKFTVYQTPGCSVFYKNSLSIVTPAMKPNNVHH